VEFVAQEAGAAVRGDAMVVTSGKVVAQDLGIAAAVHAMLAPRALRRSDTVKYGLIDGSHSQTPAAICEDNSRCSSS
jgi:hypothetical protein